MSLPFTFRALRHASVRAPRSIARRGQTSRFNVLSPRNAAAAPQITSARCFSSTPRKTAGLMPDTEDPKPPQEHEPDTRHYEATPIEPEEYHSVADEYMDEIHEKAAQIQETREDVEVEYSQGVLSITFPPNGTYVINKQPANHQIWLSSPITGPKRYDWMLMGESMDEKEGSGVADWVYLRDGSSLTGLLSKEMGITVHRHGEKDSEDPKPSVDATE